MCARYLCVCSRGAALRHVQPTLVSQEKAKKLMKQYLFSQIEIFPTSSNPNPADKIDFGDKGFGWMWVQVETARNLRAADWNGSSDPR